MTSPMTHSPPQFLDVQTLLEASEPQPRVPWRQFLLGGCVVAFILSWYVGRSTQPGDSQNLMVTLIGVALSGFIASVAFGGFVRIRRARVEHAAVSAAEELMQLRRWPEAALLLQSMLSRPARSPLARAQALLFLAMVLARYHRFEDSVVVDEYILGSIPLDDATDHAIRLGRAMSLLREENLLDADRAIAELRRTSRGVDSAGLALVEIYRDVKTGHPAEGIEIFEDRLEVMRRQLGHRVADGWALAARAYDMLDRREDAQRAFGNATILMPWAELTRRYPEVTVLASKYQPAAAPAEVA
jgi:tetratricopeptide (TPR) repeat protein